MSKPNGISVIICCHNSAKELPKTIEHLSAQQVPEDIDWEIIVVDNASTDNTAEVAKHCWLAEKQSSLRIVHEPKLGLINARYRGLAEARYEIISFVDDDNWICPDWVRLVSEVMTNHPEVGACGGKNIPEFENGKPWWFDLSGQSYAVGAQGPEIGGDITWSSARLLGAGLTLRKKAWQSLIDNGFKSLLVGCKGKALNRGEDTELCFALVLSGWHLWYEPRLQMRHFLTADRLHWRYLRRLRRGGGRATLGFDPYRFAFEGSKQSHDLSFWWKASFLDTRSPREIWQRQVLIAVKDILSHPLSLMRALIGPVEGDASVLKIETKIGRLSELLGARNTYGQNVLTVKEAKWRERVDGTPPV